jgi:AcrR family transcriptional regulator
MRNSLIEVLPAVEPRFYSGHKSTVAELFWWLYYARGVSDIGAGSAAGNAAVAVEGLRERKKRLMREQLTDTAARMFMERGFDAVRVAEVAEACGVSEKTVFNYFPTKEALVLDRLETTMTALRAGLARRDVPPVEAALEILGEELSSMTAQLRGHGDSKEAIAGYRRFGDLIRTTPSLRAYQSDMMDRFVTVAAETLAERAGQPADDPEPQIAAAALLGLWRVQFQSLRRHLADARRPADIVKKVTTDVNRAARLLETGFGSGLFDGPSAKG